MYQVAPNVSELNNSNPYAQLSNTAQQHCPIQMPPYPYGVHQQMSPLGILSGTQSSIVSPSGSISEFSYPEGSSPRSNMGILPLVNDDMVYRCNIIAQLQGNYKVETSEGQAQVSVIVASEGEGVEPYAIVRRSCSDGEALSDKVIYEWPDCFTLCSMDGVIEARMKKGSNMKCTVSWEYVGVRAPTVWRRKGDVIFNLVQVESLQTSRSTGSTGSISASAPKSIPPGQCHYNYISTMGPVLFNPSRASFASNDNSSSLGKTASKCNNPAVGGCKCEPHNPYGGIDAKRASANLQNSVVPATYAPCTEKQQALVELMKAHCVRKPSLLKRLVHWGMRTAASGRVSSKIADNLSKGRLWLAAFPAEEGDIAMSLQENLEDIKGAYRQVHDGVWKQPEPQVSEPGVQHRLLKSPGGQWKIEALDLGSGEWQLCAQELPDGRWLDMKSNGEEIVVHLIPMNRILRKLGEAHAAKSQEVEKCLEFLFKSCNQKKLNSKLKGRNLRHNIDNLKVKLEKQYSLCFAVQVASVADSIAKELEAFRVRSDQYNKIHD